MEDISGEEVRTGLRKMKKGKAQGSDDIPVKVWIALVCGYLFLFLGMRYGMNGNSGSCCQPN